MMAKVTLRNLTAHKLRLLLTAISVVLGVAMVAGTFIFTDTLTKQFDDLFNSFGKNVAVDVRAKKVVDGGDDDQASSRPPIPAAMLDTVRKVPGVKTAYPNVSGYAAVIGKNGKAVATQGPPTIGSNWVNNGDYDMKSGRAPNGPAEVAIDARTLEKAGYRLGDKVRIQLQGPTQTMTVVGIIDTGNLMGATLSAFDTTTSQRLLLKPGYLSDIQVESAGVPEAQLRDQIAGVLPGNVEAITGTQLRDENKSDIEGFLTFFRTLLLIFGFIAVFVGAFIIFNTFSMLVAQRTRELALLRAVGASRRQVTRAVLGEALAVGLVGSTLGLLGGVGLAVLLRGLLQFEGDSGLAFTLNPVIWSYAVGVTVTVLAAYFPARRAAKIPPVAAMRDDIALPQRSLRNRLVVGSVLTVAGGALVVLGVGGTGSGNTPLILLGMGAFMVFIGVAMLAPIISRPVIRVLAAAFPRVFGTTGRLARENALRNPRRTAATASALMIGLALVSMLNVAASSVSASFGQTVDKQMGADYILLNQTTGSFSPEAVKVAGSVPGVRSATALYSGPAKLAGKNAYVSAGEMTGVVAGTRLKMLSGSSTLPKDGLLVDADTAKSKGWTVGGTVPAQYADTARQRLRVTGIYEKNELTGPYLINQDTYLAHTTTPLVAVGLVQAGKTDAATKQALDRALRDYPSLDVLDSSGVKDAVQSQLDQFLAILTVLLAMSIIIAAVGVINTLALSVIERTREIGLLRAVGTSRRQLRRMIRLESVVIAVFGALLGVTIGVAFGAAIQNGLADEGFQVLSIPTGSLVTYVILGAVIGVLAALWPAWRAGRMDVLRAIATQ